MDVIIHPQTDFQIADHATRSKYQNPDIKYICGVLYGTITKNIEICSSTESLLNEVDGSLEVDKTAYSAIDLHHTKNYVEEIPIGWYSTQNFDEETISKMNSAFQKIFNVVVRIQYNQEGEHPITVFLPKEGQETKTIEWVETRFSYESELAERVAIVQLQGDGTAENRISFQQDAYVALEKQLSIIEKYLEKVKNGEIPFDHDNVRRAATIARWWKQRHINQEKDSKIPSAQISYVIGMLAETIVDYEKSLAK